VLSKFDRHDVAKQKWGNKNMGALTCLSDFSRCLVLPTSTCFNRLDLPVYQGKGELRSRLKTAITLSAVGFDMD
jgi:HECT-domain (ubiquitin-transferase)